MLDKGKGVCYNEHMSSPKIFIYTLSDPTTGAIRYVGHTKNSIEQRLYWHRVSPINRGVSQWLHDLAQAGLEPVAAVIEVVEWEDRHAVEQGHIKRLANEGCDLLNKVGNPQYWKKWQEDEHRRFAKFKILMGIS